jgi:predicted DCC family thiol-disulfide oxidoreductase YuxK
MRWFLSQVEKMKSKQRKSEKRLGFFNKFFSFIANLHTHQSHFILFIFFFCSSFMQSSSMLRQNAFARFRGPYSSKYSSMSKFQSNVNYFPCAHDISHGRAIRYQSDVSSNSDPTLNNSSKMKCLYDGECVLCKKEIEFLQKKDTKKELQFVDISKPDFDPSKHNNIDYATAMGTMHVIDQNGEIKNGIHAFKPMYDRIGLGWLWSFTTWPVFGMIQWSYVNFIAID